METCVKTDITVELISKFDSSNADCIAWEDFVSKNSFTGFMQRMDWAKFKISMGQIVRLIVVRENSVIIAGTLLFAGYDEKKPTIMVAPYGPVLPWDDLPLARKCLRLILDKAEQVAADLNAVSLRIEPRVEHPTPSILSEFGRGAVNLVPAETLLLDLTLGEKALLSQMKAKCRYNISLAERRGVRVREYFPHEQSAPKEQSASQGQPATQDYSNLQHSTPNEKSALRRYSAKNLATLVYEMLEETADRDDFYLEPATFFEALIKELTPSGMLRVFVAEHEKDILGVLLMIVDGNRATYLYGGISNSKRQLMPGYILQWSAIRAAIAAGCTSYDFYGYDQFSAPTHSYARFSRFKSGFGGTPMRYIGAQDYVFMDKLVDNVILFFNDAIVK